MGNVKLYGASSGYVEIVPTAASGTSTLTLPAATGTLATTANITTAVDAVVPAGLVHINTTTFSAESSVSLDNVFSSAYDNYRIFILPLGTVSGSTTTLSARLRVGGSDASGSNYDSQGLQISNTSVTGARTTGATSWDIGKIRTTLVSRTVELKSPFLAANTFNDVFGQQYTTAFYAEQYSQRHTLTTSYDGLTFIVSQGTMTGTVQVYGYKNGA